MKCNALNLMTKPNKPYDTTPHLDPTIQGLYPTSLVYLTAYISLNYASMQVCKYASMQVCTYMQVCTNLLKPLNKKTYLTKVVKEYALTMIIQTFGHKMFISSQQSCILPCEIFKS